MKITRKIVVASILITVIPLSFAIYYIDSLQVFSNPKKYIVTIEIDSVSNRWRSVFTNGVTVVFLKDNKTVSEHWVGFTSQNISLSGGGYTVMVYEGKSGLFIEEFQMYVAQDIEIKMAVG